MKFLHPIVYCFLNSIGGVSWCGAPSKRVVIHLSLMYVRRAFKREDYLSISSRDLFRSCRASTNAYIMSVWKHWRIPYIYIYVYHMHTKFIPYILYSIYYFLYTIYYILYTIYYVLCTIYYILYTIYYILYTI